MCNARHPSQKQQQQIRATRKQQRPSNSNDKNNEADARTNQARCKRYRRWINWRSELMIVESVGDCVGGVVCGSGEAAIVSCSVEVVD